MFKENMDINVPETDSEAKRYCLPLIYIVNLFQSLLLLFMFIFQFPDRDNFKEYYEQSKNGL